MQSNEKIYEWGRKSKSQRQLSIKGSCASWLTDKMCGQMQGHTNKSKDKREKWKADGQVDKLIEGLMEEQTDRLTC